MKYGNQEVTDLCAYGFNHRSKLERAVCQMIELLEKAGHLVHEQHECTVYLSDARIKYIPDFRCRETKSEQKIFFEAKGYADKRWPTVKKLWKHYGPGQLKIYGGSWRRPCLIEMIVPKETK